MAAAAKVTGTSDTYAERFLTELVAGGFGEQVSEWYPGIGEFRRIHVLAAVARSYQGLDVFLHIPDVGVHARPSRSQNARNSGLAIGVIVVSPRTTIWS